jgi:hypothetical protein
VAISLRSRGVSWLVISACAALATAAGLYLYVRHELAPLPISPDACPRLQTGTTAAEVARLLGRQPDKKAFVWDFVLWLAPSPGVEAEWEGYWDAPEGTLIVQFDRTGRVCARGFLGPNESVATQYGR